LGSNLGDRRSHLVAGAARLAAAGEIVAVSSLYETEPVGGPPQGPFLNAVVVMETPRSARGLLGEAQAAEDAAGRIRAERWGPRPLDVDVLLFGDAAVDEPGLTVPHPRLHLRRFALEPLVEAWPEAALPDGTPVAALLAPVSDQEVTRVESPDWWARPAAEER
jgi:2-amino-4-hydroxy-6-hydroxymethyldihydropteridine diphosphokinase